MKIFWLRAMKVLLLLHTNLPLQLSDGIQGMSFLAVGIYAQFMSALYLNVTQTPEKLVPHFTKRRLETHIISLEKNVTRPIFILYYDG